MNSALNISSYYSQECLVTVVTERVILHIVGIIFRFLIIISVVLNWGSLAHRGHLAMSEEVFDC